MKSFIKAKLKKWDGKLIIDKIRVAAHKILQFNISENFDLLRHKKAEINDTWYG